MPVSYLQLGYTRLDLITWLDGFAGQYGWGYAEHKIIENKAHLQWVGDDLQTRTLHVKLHAEYCNPMTEFYRLQAAADTHQAHLLIFANGRIEGWFVVESMQRVLTFTDAAGNVIAMELHLELREYYSQPGVAGAQPNGLPNPTAPGTIAGAGAQTLPPGIFNGTLEQLGVTPTLGGPVGLSPFIAPATGLAPFLGPLQTAAGSLTGAVQGALAGAISFIRGGVGNLLTGIAGPNAAGPLGSSLSGLIGLTPYIGGISGSASAALGTAMQVLTGANPMQALSSVAVAQINSAAYRAGGPGALAAAQIVRQAVWA